MTENGFRSSAYLRKEPAEGLFEQLSQFSFISRPFRSAKCGVYRDVCLEDVRNALAAPAASCGRLIPLSPVPADPIKFGFTEPRGCWPVAAMA